MAMVCGLDLHRRQITFDALEIDSGEEWRGRIWQPDRGRFRRSLCSDLTRRAKGERVALAVEGCTGWRCGPSSATAGASPVPSRWCATLAWTCRWTPQDWRRAGGFLSRQGPQTLRWALYEAAKNSSHLRSPDHAYYGAVKKHPDGKIAANLRGPEAGPPLLPLAARHPSRRGLRDPSLTIAAGRDGRDRPSRHQGQPRSAPATGVPASIPAGRPSNTDATARPTHGGHPIRIVVADDTGCVVHLSNAGAPAPPTGPERVCTEPRVRQGRSSSLRCGGSTLTDTFGPETSAHRAPLTGRPSHR
jgi:hypothetical protein